MSTDNKEQGSSATVHTKSGVASDDKSKGGDSGAWQGPGGGNACVSEPGTVTTGQVTAERGGSAVDDRSKDFEVFDDPKA